jgi:hypothetical protein
MADLNETVLPSVWTLARRALVQGPAASLDVLIERLTPTGLLRRTGDGAATSRHVGPSLRALLSLGLITEADDGAVSLVEAACEESEFRFRVGQALLPIPDGDDPWLVREGAGRLEYHLEVAVAWTQLLGMRSAIDGWPAASEALDRQFGVDRPLLRDTAPYNTLERLVNWLGIAVRTSQAIVPDPTEMVRAALPSLLDRDACSAQDFLERSATTFPWMPHGRVGQAVATRMRSVPDQSSETGRFPEGLSLALVRLAVEGTIELVPGDDPKSRVLLSFAGQPERGVAQVVLV